MPLSPEDLQHMTGPPPFDLLDFGCGPGRDLHTFKALLRRAVVLEGAPSAAARARAHRGCAVLEQSFLQLELPSQRYDLPHAVVAMPADAGSTRPAATSALCGREEVVPTLKGRWLC